ncbi:isoflavone reductase family protein [Grosmannia clavigera kw1407]|uniref:Isoflavone reductase family protein n=1 Tax=Grosmannia clavigera (strain kw1407 / UAMH 11150) TaxID=655863 RepID=F0XJ70_GROCL|nr:isoflavone reductase family protein [Grosmannia clavigera kw1407]EFX02284.1 isoflavone reductase family protein [Grosmannia clavigera kw1407]
MTPPSKRILVLGATGVIGKVLVDALVRAGDAFDTIGLFTSPDTVARKKELIDSFVSRGVVVRTGDIDADEDVLEAYKDFDTVVSAVGRNAIEKQVRLIDLAAHRAPSIVRFLPSEFGTDIDYCAASAAEIPHQKKRRVRACLAGQTSLAYSFVVTGPFADLFIGNLPAEPRVGSFDLVTRTAFLAAPDGPVGLTTMADVGRALVAVLHHPDVCDGRAVYVHSFVTTPATILAEFERQTASSNAAAAWTVHHTTLSQLRDIEQDARAHAAPLADLFTLRRIWAEGGTLYDHMDNEAIGLTSTDSLEDVVHAAVERPVAAFQSGEL